MPSILSPFPIQEPGGENEEEEEEEEEENAIEYI